MTEEKRKELYDLCMELRAEFKLEALNFIYSNVGRDTIFGLPVMVQPLIDYAIDELELKRGKKNGK